MRRQRHNGGMGLSCNSSEHVQSGISPLFSPASGDLVRVNSRRWFLQTGLTGMAGLTLPALLKQRAEAAKGGKPKSKKNVILFWLSGGPSHIDMWDPKPDAPSEIRGPFDSIPTKIPGVRVSEHLPLTAKLMDKLTILRGVDCSASNHTPITMQAGNPLARRTNDGKDGAGYPSMGSIAAKFKGPNRPGMPAFVGLADSWRSDVWEAGHMGGAFSPVNGKKLAGRLALPEGLTDTRIKRSTPSSLATPSARLISKKKRPRRAIFMGATASAKRRCSPGGSWRPAPPLCSSAARGATSTITAMKCAGAVSLRASSRCCRASTECCTRSSPTSKSAV